MICDFQHYTNRVQRCRVCGRTVALALKPDGTVLEPDLGKMPPCGWKPLVHHGGGHAWIERHSPDGRRRFVCGRCRETIESAEQGLSDAAIRQLLDEQPDCKAAVSQPASENPPSADTSPSIAGTTQKYLTAVARWTAAGFPKRSDEEVERIYDLCRACKWMHEDGYCRKCGCRINRSKQGLTNKIRMATEHCPLPEPKW